MLKIISLSMNILKKFIDLLIESLSDNRKLIIVMAVLFVVCFIGAWVFSSGLAGSGIDQIQNMPASSPGMDDGTGPFELFINNEASGILTYVGSIFFGIFAVVSLAYNGVNMGMLGQLFSQMVPNGGLKYIVYLIPHGIFELTATVLESAAGIMLFLFIWRFVRAWMSKETNGASDAFEKSKKILIQSLIIMIFTTILLIIAAPIEAYISVPFSEMIVGA
jgi:uncharacterized membrane protein SpoIIM required for sporulation